MRREFSQLTFEVFMIPAKLRYSVRKLFENSGFEEYQNNRKSGVLNVRALPTMAHNDRLFKRRKEHDGIDSAVVIVLDVSGSMFKNKDPLNSKMYHAILATYALLDTLSKAGVATSVVTFGCEVSMLKDFNTPYQRVKSLLESLYAGGGTNDSMALQFAHNLLLSRQEERRVCFLISDGIGDADHCREQALIGENLGLTTIGIGIRSDVTHIYKNAVTIDKIEDMGTVAFDKLKLAA
jgi:cobalamin biosynthesis protein CobT